MKINNRQQLLTIAAMAAVGLLAVDRLAYTPLVKLWKSRSADIVELHGKIAGGTSLIQREQVLRRRWEQMRSNTLPVNSSQAEQQLLKAIDNWSQQSRVSLASIMPQWKHDADDYMTLDCRVEATGDLDTLSQFVYSLEKDPMALKVESLELNSHDNTGRQMTLGLQISGLVLTTGEQ